MKNTCYFLVGLMSLLLTSCSESRKAFLEKTLENLENIQSATYQVRERNWMPGDTLCTERFQYIKEYNNPADTTIGASFLVWNAADTLHLLSCYDGKVHVYFSHEHQEVSVNDFSAKKHLPYRPLASPFFQYTKSILRYMLTTTDSIHIEWLDDTVDCHHLRLTIYEDEQVEFFGRAFHLPIPPFPQDPTSVYELWIGKSDYLPRKYRREMDRDITEDSCMNVWLNRTTPVSIQASDYIPQGYEVHHVGEKQEKRPTSTLLGLPAPAWTLADARGDSLSLSDVKSKVIVLNFTGIGCGPCALAMPFLNELSDRFALGACKVISVECWGHQPHSLSVYADKHQMRAPFLVGTERIIRDYLNGDEAVPAFFILDSHRVVRKIFRGYSLGTTDEEIVQSVCELLVD